MEYSDPKTFLCYAQDCSILPLLRTLISLPHLTLPEVCEKRFALANLFQGQMIKTQEELIMALNRHAFVCLSKAEPAELTITYRTQRTDWSVWFQGFPGSKKGVQQAGGHHCK